MPLSTTIWKLTSSDPAQPVYEANGCRMHLFQRRLGIWSADQYGKRVPSPTKLKLIQQFVENGAVPILITGVGDSVPTPPPASNRIDQLI